MQPSTYCFDAEPVSGFKALCTRMAGKALQSPFRSTVPLLSLIEHGKPDWQALLALLGSPPAGTIHFEYCVPSPKVDGNPSQTDAMLISDRAVWAIEAKWTEPRYETVAKRIARPEVGGTNSRDTAAGWLQYLQPFATRDLRLDDALDVVYQVMHRAASACYVASEKQLRPHLVYLHFHPSPLPSSATTAEYVEDLRRLRALLGSESGIDLAVIEQPLRPLPAFDAIKDLDKRARASSARVKAALCYGPLFDFSEPIVTRV